MKSQVNALLHVLQGLRKDILAAYPALKGLDFDFERLALYCQTRGLTLFTLDLPNLDSLLLQGLETGRLVCDGPLSKEVSKQVKVPRLFSGLWLRVFDKNASLRQGADVTAVFFLRQLCCLGKRIQVDCSPDRIQATLENYHGIERRLRFPSLEWGADILVFDKSNCQQSLADCSFDSFAQSPIGGGKANRKDCKTKTEKDQWQEEFECRSLLNKVQQVADLIIGAFMPFNSVVQSDVLESYGFGTSFRHGPGAVSDRVNKSERSDFISWPDKLQHMFPFEQVGKTAGSGKVRPINHEVASRLICVPKTAKGPRLIAAEPTSHMWCQQSMRWFLNFQLERLFETSFIDFHDQNKSGNMVLSASKKGDLATVDLSDASDRLSCWVVERIFRKSPSVLCGLHSARTRYLRDDVSKIPNFLRLRKFASQGTAVTFPVQSIVFLCIALGACIEGNVTWDSILRLRDQVRVFGDDIIIPKHGYERLVLIMHKLELKVNMAKSYVNGNFRESCGTDGFMGYNVTPVKPKTLVADSPASCQAVVDTINNLFNKGLWHASYSLESLLPARVKRGIRIVGQRDTGFAGLTSFSGCDESHLITRWNNRLHRNEVRVWTLSVKTRSRDRQGFSAMLDFVSNIHDPRNPRIVSADRETWKTRDRFLWEPANSDALTTSEMEKRRKHFSV